MSDIDPAVAREMEALRTAFTYRSLKEDLDRVFADTDRAMFGEANRGGRSIYAVGSEFVLDSYYERGALEPLVKAYSGQPYRVASRFDRLLRHLQEAGRVDLIERFWTAIARLTRAEFYHQRPRRDHGDHEGAEEFKNYALEAYAQGIDWLRRMGRPEPAQRLNGEREALLEERLPPPPTREDPRRVDAAVFWELIAEARARGPTTLEQITSLGEALRAFGASEIERFGSHYARLMKKLHHWNAWALAWAARGGCSDGAFEEFRTWLILQGDPSLLDLAVTDPAEAARRVPPEPDLPDGTAWPVIEEAYLRRKGSSLAPPSFDLDRPKGREWTEETLATRFPALVERYASTTE